MSVRLISGILLCVAMAFGQNAPRSIADASLEELMNIEVTSVSKKAQRLASTAASAYVISAEDIRRSGITVLPELLRLAPGVQVARLSTGSWAIGIRGFNDEYSNKLLVLVDGRSVYNEFFAVVFWDALNVPVDDIERIEVIRGPGAAMWGTNAVNGVINIITKTAKTTKGAQITVGGGSETTLMANVRYGGDAGSNTQYRIGAQNSEVDPFQIVGSVSPSHAWANRSADFRLDLNLTTEDSLTVSGGMYRSGYGSIVPAIALASNTPPADDQTITSGGNVTASWQHVFSDTSTIEAHFSYSHMFRNDPETGTEINTFDYEIQQHKVLGSRNDVIWGFTFRDHTFHSQASPSLWFIPPNDTRKETAVFAQDEIALIPDKLHFIAGAQLSHDQDVGYSIQPTGRLLWTPRSNLSTWAAVSRAVRIPSIDERGLEYFSPPIAVPGSPLLAVANFAGNPNVQKETVLAYEAGQRVQVSKQLSFDLSTFYNVYQHLVSFVTTAPVVQCSAGVPYLLIPISTANDRQGVSYGEDLSATWNASSRWRLTGGYSWLRVETHPNAGEVSVDQFRTSSATPHHQWQVRSYFDVTPKLQIDTAFYYTAAMLETGIPQHLRGDLRIGWRFSPKVEISAGVQDAFRANHLEYESTRFNQLAEVPRNVYGKVTWRF